MTIGSSISVSVMWLVVWLVSKNDTDLAGFLAFCAFMGTLAIVSGK